MKINKVYGLLGLARRAGKISFGTQSSIETIKNKKAYLVIVAEDSSKRTKESFANLANEKQLPIREIGTIEELSKAIGQVNKAIIVIKEKNFAEELIRIIDGGEVIG